jgi:four helix bundle protein
MAINRFEDIIAWQKAQDLAEVIYLNFRELKDFSFRDQICRASVSISNNIAEGFGRGIDADFRRFLYIALGSCFEVKSMIHLSERLKYCDATQKQLIGNLCDEIAKILNGLIKSLK